MENLFKIGDLVRYKSLNGNFGKIVGVHGNYCWVVFTSFAQPSSIHNTKLETLDNKEI